MRKLLMALLVAGAILTASTDGAMAASKGNCSKDGAAFATTGKGTVAVHLCP
jgi:hypothetical protein